LLSLQHVGNGVALAAMLVRTRDRVAPRRRIVGVAGEKVGDARMIEDVVRCQPPDPRKSPDVDGKPGARRIPATNARVGTGRGRQTGWGLHLWVLLQSLRRSVKKPSCECYDRMIP
jgi:hypothetical protein